jgi:23S rRNA (cytidine2498-2'-O)-methyltransferase
MSNNALNPFVFVICQAGAEAAARKEILELPGFRLAFSLPGFLTFKVEPGSLPERFSLPVTLARTCGWSLGKVSGEEANQLVAEICQQDIWEDCQHLHVYERETVVPGTKGFEPGTTILAAEIGELFAMNDVLKTRNIAVNRVAKVNQKVIDVVLVKPNEWWFGYHWTVTRPSRWPGGVPIFDTSEAKASRAYYKLKEALLWSGIKIAPGDVCAEIGAAPGGACELLLEMGAKVIAIDPAELEPEIEAHENLIYLRRRGHEVKKKDFKDVKWLLADLNIAPKYSLDTVRDIVAHEAVDIRGLILTLKLSEWELVGEVRAYLERVGQMGFQVVKARQLAFNRREFCLVAIKDKFALRSGKRAKKKG